jgi:ribonuclease HI
MEYQGVYTASKKLIFHMGPFEEGTNNIGEFLAIVHALALCKKENIKLPIYSDSITAISWIKKKKANSKLVSTEKNEKLFDLIERAEKWLKENTYSNQILKWLTQVWGEIPADFGRK